MSGNFVSLDYKTSAVPALYVAKTASTISVFVQWQSKIVNTALLPTPMSDALQQSKSFTNISCNLVPLTASHLPAYLAQHLPRTKSTKGDKVTLEWCTHLWSWLASVPRLETLLTPGQLQGYAIVPDSKGYLHSLPDKFIPSSVLPQALRNLLEKLGVRLLSAIIAAKQLKAWDNIVPNDQRLSVLLTSMPSDFPALQQPECTVLRDFILQEVSHIGNAPSSTVTILGRLPIWPVLQSGLSNPAETVLMQLGDIVFWVANDVFHIPTLPSGMQLVKCNDTSTGARTLCVIVDKASSAPHNKEVLLSLALKHWALQQDGEAFLVEIVNSMHALFGRSPVAKTLLQAIPIIAVKGSTTLACLNRIILPGSSIEDLYFADEHVIPTPGEMQKSRWQQFIAFGLVPMSLTPDLARERLAHYEQLRKNGYDLKKLSRKLVDLLKLLDCMVKSNNDVSFLETNIINILLQELQATAPPPQGYMKGLCRDRLGQFNFDLVLPVVPYRVDSPQLRQALKWSDNVSFETICAQFSEAIKRPSTDLVRVTRIITILQTLATRALSGVEALTLVNVIQGKEWVPTETKALVSAKHALCQPADRQPSFFAVSSDLRTEECIKFLNKLGIADSPDLDMLLASLQDQKSKKLNAAELRSVVKVLEAIAAYPKEEYYQALLVPSMDNALMPGKHSFDSGCLLAH